ncbi:hypothetical protein T06_1471 [Trichinella sp. T6]|nr:hypothetical protein T06_1471 [Trichinella sp. T6]
MSQSFHCYCPKAAAQHCPHPSHSPCCESSSPYRSFSFVFSLSDKLKLKISLLLKNKNPKHQTTRRHLSIEQSRSSIDFNNTRRQLWTWKCWPATDCTRNIITHTHKKVTPAEPWPDRAGQQQMVILADFLMPWRLCRKLRRRPLLPWSLVDGRCATRTLGPSSNLGVAVDDSVAAVENELNRVRTSVELMLNRMDESPDEALPNCSEEECVVCLSGKASLQTFPCGHMVLCRRCFVKTIQVALDERQLPLRCIICRSRIVRLKQQISSRCRVAVRTEPVVSTQPMFSSEFESSSMPSSAIRRPDVTGTVRPQAVSRSR